jgi:hypothetical protein
MGACTFTTSATGATPREAFNEAVQRALYDYGHAGYTGTLAEKCDFVHIPLPEGKDPHKYANELIDASDPRINDKWGPAGCLPLSGNKWLFFGWASS